MRVIRADDSNRVAAKLKPHRNLHNFNIKRFKFQDVGHKPNINYILTHSINNIFLVA